MIKTDYEIKLGKVLGQEGHFHTMIIKSLQASNLIVEREYKKEAPVDKGTLRNSVITRNTSEGYEVTTLAGASSNIFTRQSNASYPFYVHHGTYDYKGDTRDYGVRGMGVTRNKNRFSQLKGGKKGIRPNKYADRAREIAQPKVLSFWLNKVKSLLNT